MTPAQSRQKLADLRQRAADAGLAGAVGQVDVALAIAAQHCIGVLQEALAAVPAPARDNPLISAIPLPQMPSTVRLLPSPQAVGQPAAAPRASVLTGLKKSRPARQAHPTFRPPSMSKMAPKPTGLLPDDLDIPF